eukprot:TRINITY_DN65881_c0_g1_i1.p1 TRINITY_DN65881_c0_g1~~TRINITY_DN65881_c0_g1_i1.p1  ORF type:complete len:466 (+),score=69.81 TRINITY_DN65881_c0_g1_i1:172-1398(+)
MHFGRVMTISEPWKLVREISFIMLASLLNGALAAAMRWYMDHSPRWFECDATPWTLLGVLQSFLITFQVNQSYQNFMRGRESYLHGSSAARQVAMHVQGMFPTECERLKQLVRGMNYVMNLEDIMPEEWEAAGQRNAAMQRDIGRLLAAAHYINTLHLMGDASLPPEVCELLTQTERKQLRQAKVGHRAGVRINVLGGWISKLLGSPGTPAQPALALMFQHWVVCRRIATTPLPSTYRTITDLCLFPWLMTLPFLLSSRSQEAAYAAKQQRSTADDITTEHIASYLIPTIMTGLITAIYMMLRFLSRHLHNPFSGVVRLPLTMSNQMVLDDLGVLLPGCLQAPLANRPDSYPLQQIGSGKTKYRDLAESEYRERFAKESSRAASPASRAGSTLMSPILASRTHSAEHV